MSLMQIRFSDLSNERQLFVRACQRIGFGRIEALEVCGSEPVFGAETGVFIDLKLDSDHVPRAELVLADFALSTELQRFFSMLDSFRNGHVELIEVRAGIPRRLIFKTSVLFQK